MSSGRSTVVEIGTTSSQVALAKARGDVGSIDGLMLLQETVAVVLTYNDGRSAVTIPPPVGR
jgi:hypothetical protein